MNFQSENSHLIAFLYMYFIVRQICPWGYGGGHLELESGHFVKRERSSFGLEYMSLSLSPRSSLSFAALSRLPFSATAVLATLGAEEAPGESKIFLFSLSLAESSNICRSLSLIQLRKGEANFIEIISLSLFVIRVKRERDEKMKFREL